MLLFFLLAVTILTIKYCSRLFEVAYKIDVYVWMERNVTQVWRQRIKQEKKQGEELDYTLFVFVVVVCIHYLSNSLLLLRRFQLRKKSIKLSPTHRR